VTEIPPRPTAVYQPGLSDIFTARGAWPTPRRCPLSPRVALGFAAARTHWPCPIWSCSSCCWRSRRAMSRTRTSAASYNADPRPGRGLVRCPCPCCGRPSYCCSAGPDSQSVIHKPWRCAAPSRNPAGVFSRLEWPWGTAAASAGVPRSFHPAARRSAVGSSAGLLGAINRRPLDVCLLTPGWSRGGQADGPAARIPWPRFISRAAKPSTPTGVVTWPAALQSRFSVSFSRSLCWSSPCPSADCKKLSPHALPARRGCAHGRQERASERRPRVTPPR